MNIYDKIFKYLVIGFLFIWPWQTRYIYALNANEFLTRSFYISDLLLIVIFIFVVFGKRIMMESRELLHYFALGLVPVAVLAIMQFGLQETWPTKWLGLANHESSMLGQVVIDTISGRYLRAYGSFDHPNILGGVMVVAILVLMINKKKTDLLDIFLIAIFSAALFVSFSRTAWLGLVVGILALVILAVFRFKNDNIFIIRLKKLSIVIFLIFSLFSLIYSSLVFSRLEASNRIERKSINERLSYYSEAKALFVEQPILGVGYGLYVPSLMAKYPGREPWGYQPVHNTFFLILVEMGIFGLLALGLILHLLYAKYVVPLNQQAVLGVGAVWLAVIMMMLFDHWWWSLHTGQLLIGLLGIYSVRLNSENN